MIGCQTPVPRKPEQSASIGRWCTLGATVFAREFEWRRFVHGVWATAPMRDYCARHGVPCPKMGPHPPTAADEFTGWAAYRALDRDTQAAIEFDARRVNELATPDANALLLEAAGDEAKPPPDVPAGQALSLWYFLHHPALFREVFHRYRSTPIGVWRFGRATPGLMPDRLQDWAATLTALLPTVFEDRTGVPGAAVEGYTTPDGFVFEVLVSERVQRISAFSPQGLPAVVDIRPAATVVFTYEAATGAVRLYSRQQSRTRVRSLFDVFGRAVGCPVRPEPRVYDLDRLKRPVLFAPDGPDMEAVRVRALSLTYPPHHARRRLTLEAAATDDPEAVYDLVRTHVDRHLLDQMSVTHAELLVSLRSAGDRRGVPVRLWADGCSLAHDRVGLRLLDCLTSWGLGYA